jgi:hypothetical protein
MFSAASPRPASPGEVGDEHSASASTPASAQPPPQCCPATPATAPTSPARCSLPAQPSARHAATSANATHRTTMQRPDCFPWADTPQDTPSPRVDSQTPAFTFARVRRGSDPTMTTLSRSLATPGTQAPDRGTRSMRWPEHFDCTHAAEPAARPARRANRWIRPLRTLCLHVDSRPSSMATVPWSSSMGRDATSVGGHACHRVRRAGSSTAHSMRTRSANPVQVSASGPVLGGPHRLTSSTGCLPRVILPRGYVSP